MIFLLKPGLSCIQSRSPTRARVSFYTTHGHYPCFHPRRHARLKVYPQLPAQTLFPKHPLKYLASHNSQEARQPKTSRTTNSNAQDPNARNENARNENPGTRIQERESRNENPGTRIQERGSSNKTSRNKTPQNEGQHALNSRSATP